MLRAALLCCLTLAIVAPANAQPIDCEKLKASTVPYELVFENEGSITKSDGTVEKSVRESLVQVYRQADGYFVAYSPYQNKYATKTEGRFSFLMNATYPEPSPLKSTSFRHSINLDKDLRADKKSFTDEISSETISKEGAAVTSTATATYRYIEDGYSTVGPCRFKTTTYEQITKEDGPTDDEGSKTVKIVSAILSYSPELMRVLGAKTEVKLSNNKILSNSTSSAKRIRTDFTPLPQ